MSADQLAQVLKMVDEMERPELQALDERVHARLSEQPERKYQSLRGIAAGLLPDDFDVEAAIREIRSSWHHRIEFADEEEPK